MKKYILLFSFLVAATLSFAQSLDVTSKSFYSYNSTQTIKVIKPTLQNFMTLINLSNGSFAATIKKYGYHPMDDSGNYLVYTNATIDNVSDSYACNMFWKSLVRKELRFTVSYDSVYPRNSISDLCSSLKSHLMKSNSIGNYYVFKYGGHSYDLYVTTCDDVSSYDIQLIQR